MKKEAFCMAVGALASAGVKLFGGWTPTLSVVLIMMGLDMALGLVVAIFFKNSPKTESGTAQGETSTTKTYGITVLSSTKTVTTIAIVAVLYATATRRPGMDLEILIQPGYISQVN